MQQVYGINYQILALNNLHTMQEVYGINYQTVSEHIFFHYWIN